MKLSAFPAFSLFLLFAGSAFSANLHQATVTRIVNQVDILPPGGTPVPASLGEIIRGRTGVRTGEKSRTELTFSDQTLARLGANSVFSFENGTRNLDLSQGTILLQVPKNAGGATIKTSPVTAAITGTTLMLEHSPGNPGTVKLIVLEGEVRLSLNGVLGESVLVKAGQMVTLPDNARRLPDPEDVDLKRILKTSRLINDGELSSMDIMLSDAEIQQELKNRGVLLEVNYAIRDDTSIGLNPGPMLNSMDQRRDLVRQPAPPAPQQAPPPVAILPPPPQPKPSPQPTPPLTPYEP